MGRHITCFVANLSDLLSLLWNWTDGSIHIQSFRKQAVCNKSPTPGFHYMATVASGTFTDNHLSGQSWRGAGEQGKEAIRNWLKGRSVNISFKTTVLQWKLSASSYSQLPSLAPPSTILAPQGALLEYAWLPPLAPLREGRLMSASAPKTQPTFNAARSLAAQVAFVVSPVLAQVGTRSPVSTQFLTSKGDVTMCWFAIVRPLSGTW